MDELEIIEYAHKVFNIAGWEFCGIFVAAILATRGTNIAKAFKRSCFPRLPRYNPFVWHTLTFTQAFLYSAYSFHFKYENLEAIAFVSFILASFNSAIIEWVYWKVEKHGAVNGVVNKMMFIDEEEDDMMTRIGAFAAGVTVKIDQRKKLRDEHEDAITRILTKEEQDAITGRDYK